MKKHTIYKATLVDGRHIRSKSLAKLRRFAPQILKFWREQRIAKDTWSTCGYSGYYLDKALRRPTKGKYRTEYFVDGVWVVNSDPLEVSTRVTLRLRLKIQRQSRSPR